MSYRVLFAWVRASSHQVEDGWPRCLPALRTHQEYELPSGHTKALISQWQNVQAEMPLRCFCQSHRCDGDAHHGPCLRGQSDLPTGTRLSVVPVVPPKSNLLRPWHYDRALYRKRNEIQRLFRRLKGYRRIFSRFDKLGTMLLVFSFAFS